MIYPPSTVIRVAMARNPPDAFSDCRNFPTYLQTIQCQFPGWCLEVLYMITSAMNVTIDPVLTPWKPGEVVWGNLNETTQQWTGTLGMLQNQSVDTICLMFQKTTVRTESFDFANTILSVRPTYVVKERTESYAELAANVYKSFNLNIWLTMIVLTVVQGAVVLLISKIESRLFDKKCWNPGQTIWMMYEYFVDQKNDNDYPDPESASGKITLTVWALCQCVIMSGLYRGLLLSQLLNPIEVKPFDSVSQMVQLIAQNEYSLTTNNIGNWYFDELQWSQGDHYVQLRKAIANNPVVQAASVDAALDLVDTGKYIFPIQEDSSAMQFAKKRCSLVFISEGLPERTTHFIFQKNSSWIKSWNEQIILTQQFQQRTFRKYFESGFIIGEKPHCPQTASDQSQLAKALDIWSIMGVLLVALAGTAISFVALFVEKIVRWREYIAKFKFKSPIFAMTTRTPSALELVKNT